MADINDRLERLNRRDELTRRMLQHRAVPEPVALPATVALIF